MKKSELILGAGLLLSMFVAMGAIATATLSATAQRKALAEQREQFLLSEERERELQKSVSDLKAEVIAAKLLSEERGKEVSNLRNQTAELEKQAADLKSRSQFSGRRNPRALNFQVPEANVEPLTILGLQDNLHVRPLGAEIPPDMLRQLQQTIQVTPNGVPGGVITINGETIQVLGNREGLNDVRIQFNNGVPPPAPAPAEPKKAEPLDEQF